MSNQTSPVPSGEDDILADPMALSSLKRGELGLRHAIVISLAVISPAASIFFNSIPQAGLVGAAIPLCYVIGFILALLMANQYSEMSRELPSSGSAYTFVTEGIGPRWGGFTAWVGFIAIAIGVPYSFILMSANLQTLMLRWFGFNLHWSFWFVLAVGIVFAICYRGVRQSMTVDLTLLIFEIGICLILALIVLFQVGAHGGLSAAPFTTAPIPPGGDLTTGIVLGVLSFIGFETAATLGEETRDPHRNIPRAVYFSMLVAGVFYIVLAYAATIGYGMNNIVTGYAHDTAPFDTIARRFGGNTLAVLVDVVGILSFFGAALAIINGGARILFAVGRDGLLPSWMARTHPRYHTPVGPIMVLCLVGLIVGIGFGLWLTPIGSFTLFGTLDALFVLTLYGLVNVACIRFFWQQRRQQFRLVRHGIVPCVSTLMIAVILVSALISPGSGPLTSVPFVFGIWCVLGLLVLFLFRGKFVRA